MNKQNIRTHIPQHLTKLRQAANLSQDDVANAIGVTRPAYGSYEEVRAIPPLHILIELKRLYGYATIDALLGIGDLIGLSEEMKQLGGNDQPPIIGKYRIAPPHVRKAIDVLLSGG